MLELHPKYPARSGEHKEEIAECPWQECSTITPEDWLTKYWRKIGSFFTKIDNALKADSMNPLNPNTIRHTDRNNLGDAIYARFEVVNPQRASFRTDLSNCPDISTTDIAAFPRTIEIESNPEKTTVTITSGLPRLGSADIQEEPTHCLTIKVGRPWGEGQMIHVAEDVSYQKKAFSFRSWEGGMQNQNSQMQRWKKIIKGNIFGVKITTDDQNANSQQKEELIITKTLQVVDWLEANFSFE